MKKILLSLLMLASIFFWVLQTFASWEADGHFVTLDWRDMCGEWGDSFTDRLFIHCSAIGIVYENGKVIKWDEPFFGDKVNGIITVGDEKLCVKNGKQVEPLSKCNTSYTIQQWEISETCNIIDGVPTCTPQPTEQGVNIISNDYSPQSEELKVGQGNETPNGIIQDTINSWNCTVNGESVDCDQAMKEVGWFLKAGLWVMTGFGVVSFVGFVFWLMMLVHACSNNIPNKVLWIVLLFLFGIIAAIVYYFVIKRHCVANYIPPVNTQPYQANITVGYQEGPVATTPFVAPVPPTPSTTPPANPIMPIINTSVPNVPPTIPTPTQTVESMIATSRAETMSQAPLESSSIATPTVSPDQKNASIQNQSSTNV